ncbi:hypothetical protein FKM82_003980 [Ascaphus truei]
MQVLHVVLLACFGVALLSTISQAMGVVSKQTCLKLDSAKPFKGKLKAFLRQNMPFEAILFTTKNNLYICADPKLDWVKKAVQTLEKRSVKNGGGGRKKN